jgi:type III secretion protein U
LRCSAPLLRSSLTPLVGGSLVVFLAFAIGDLLLQRWLFRRDMRMSLTDKKNEAKNTEGNPLVRKAHKRERREASSMRLGMHEATFVIAGSRVAVAMRYSVVDTRVPMLVARTEADQLLAFIRAARRRNLPIVHDSDIARALFEQVEIGKRIPRELFQPVIDCMNQIPKEEATKA